MKSQFEWHPGHFNHSQRLPVKKFRKCVLAFMVVSSTGCGGGGGSDGPNVYALNGRSAVRVPTSGETASFAYHFRQTASAFPDFLVDVDGMTDVTFTVTNKVVAGRPTTVIQKVEDDQDPEVGVTRDTIHVDASGHYLAEENLTPADDEDVQSQTLPMLWPANLSVGATYGSAEPTGFAGDDYARQCTIAAIETIDVPAGRFETFRIECTEQRTTREDGEVLNTSTAAVIDWLHPLYGLIRRSKEQSLTYASGTGHKTSSEELVESSVLP